VISGSFLIELDRLLHFNLTFSRGFPQQASSSTDISGDVTAAALPRTSAARLRTSSDEADKSWAFSTRSSQFKVGSLSPSTALSFDEECNSVSTLLALSLVTETDDLSQLYWPGVFVSEFSISDVWNLRRGCGHSAATLCDTQDGLDDSASRIIHGFRHELGSLFAAVISFSYIEVENGLR
jgi:hypothetical protein